MKNLLRKFMDWLGSTKCNRCGCRTPYSKSIRDISYDDYGYQCIACATDSGLLKNTKEREIRYKQMLERRKEFGL